MESLTTLIPKDLSDWESWLITHHEAEPFVWVRIRKAHSPLKGILLAEAVLTALRFGWIDGKLSPVDQDFYDLRFSPRRSDSVWSLRNRKRAEMLMDEGSMAPKGLEAVRVAKATGTWQSAVSVETVPEIPEDLALELSRDPQLRQAFGAWTRSDKLQWLTWFNQAKQPQTRARRLMKLLSQIRNTVQTNPQDAENL